MGSFAAPVLYALFVWWFSTGLILFLDGLPRRTFPRTMGVATALLAAGLATLFAVRDDGSAFGAYAGFTAALNLNPTTGPMVSLPLATFEFVKSPEPTMIARGFGTAAVLMGLVLILFIIARIIGGRGPGNLSKRQQKQRAKRSRSDSQRFTQRAAARRASEEEFAASSMPKRTLDFGDSS